ncbi:hypothetical protein Tco_0571147, partial [Tanacetum coccineum]
VYFDIKRICVFTHIISAPTTVHWAAVLDILRYLPGTQFQTLLFPSTFALDLRAYCDSDCAGDVVSHKSTTGFCIFLGDYLISWKSKKQDVLSKSSIETEYRAMVVTTSEIVWSRWLLADMGVRISHSTSLYCDNRSAIQIARNSVFMGFAQKSIELEIIIADRLSFHSSSSSGWHYLSIVCSICFTNYKCIYQATL